jgi:hypothetical protein
VPGVIGLPHWGQEDVESVLTLVTERFGESCYRKKNVFGKWLCSREPARGFADFKLTDRSREQARGYSWRSGMTFQTSSK